MRIGIVVDSTCDLPVDYLREHQVEILPISVRIGDELRVDYRDEAETLAYLRSHIAERGASAETIPFSVEQIRDLFLKKLVVDYDHVFCITVTSTRSPIFDHATQASYAILNEYRPIRAAAGHNTPFALRVVDTRNLFSAQGVLPVEAIRLRAAGDEPGRIRQRLEELAVQTWGYLVPRDLYYIRNRARHKGDRSVGLFSAALGTALDIKPVLACNRGETGPVAKIRGFDPAVRAMFEFAARRVEAGLLTPTVCLCYGGDLSEMRAMPGYEALRSACADRGVEVFESIMSLTGMVNVGSGAVCVGFAAPDHAFG
ncbi:DegV family protein with EDD domain [Luteimonas sp. J16]|jgi:DegV family protein with EDD domain|uniref:DegV family protein n=1 Tax=unclassified Luteimonas TaxID=2629088 RepID=UPI00047EC014|nr:MULTISPECIES: DegV family protein [unclassified Luteimonas]TWG92199.1 DegV family protein with EDD domain [Luteimonas sp. J16]